MVYRSGKSEQSWTKGRSCCEDCGEPIAWYDNIPLVSYCLLGGRCRHCQESINLVHPLIELLTGLIFAGVTVWQSAAGLNFYSLLFWLIVVSCSWLIFLFDLFYLIIPDPLVLILWLCGLGLNTVAYVQGQLSLSALGATFVLAIAATAVFWFLRWITKQKGMGLGDVKLIGALVLLMGFPAGMVGVLLAFIIGGFFGIILIVLGQKKLKNRIAFGPFLVVSFWIALIWGKLLWQWYWQLTFMW